MQNAPLPLLLEPQQLSAHLADAHLLILDLCSPQLYGRAHIPGAVHLPYARLSYGQLPTPGALPNIAQLQQVFGEIGYQPNQHIVVYDDEGGGWAGRLIWVLDCIGHKNYSYLNGGLQAWLQDQLPTESTPHRPESTQATLTLSNDVNADKQNILAHLKDIHRIIWDARSAEEYSGMRAFAQKSGHIPGAVNYEWTRAMDRSRGLRLRPFDDIRVELAELGITPDKEIITHCQTHHRSGFTYLLGKILGFPNIKAYPGSWAEWGNDPTTPVETNA